MKIFSSDLHYHHTNIVKFTDRKKFVHIDDHTDWLIKLHNKQVSDGDTFYHLGDFSFSTKEGQVAEVLRQLNGEKIFIRGNHDNESLFAKMLAQNYIQWFGDYKEIKIGKEKAVLFHYPIGSWHHQARGKLHLHGHCHGSYTDSKGKMLDAGIDSAYNIFGEHKYFTEDFVLEYMQKQTIYVSDHHSGVK